MPPDSALLFDAVLAGPYQGEMHWRKWRAETDLDGMSAECVRLLPVLVARSSEWLVDDPAKNRILGICKRAWTQNQLFLSRLRQLIDSLARAGITQLGVAGPAAWALIHQNSKSFRPVGVLELWVPREEAARTVQALESLGWLPAPGCELPEPDGFDYAAGMWFRSEAGEALKLSWRLFPAPPEFAAEWEALPQLETVEFQGAELRILAKEALLASALSADRVGDDFDWRCDASLLLREGEIDWSLVEKWIRFSPDAKNKVCILARDTDVQIPEHVLREPKQTRARSQWAAIWADYRRCAWCEREPRSLSGFLDYLCVRWRAPVWQLPFLGLFYVLRYTFSDRARSG